MKTTASRWALGSALTIAGLLFTTALLTDSQGASPLLLATPEARQGNGRLVETLPAGSYSYLRLDTEPAQDWFVVMGPAPELGTQLNFRTYAVSTDFYSPRLKRRFERIYFTSITLQGNTHEL